MAPGFFSRTELVIAIVVVVVLAGAGIALYGGTSEQPNAQRVSPEPSAGVTPSANQSEPVPPTPVQPGGENLPPAQAEPVAAPDTPPDTPPAVADSPATETASAQEASNGEYVHVVGTAPLPDRPFTGDLVVFFDHPIGKVEAPPITFEPALQGRFSVAQNHVAFYTSSVPPNTVIQANLNPALKSEDGLPVDPKQRSIALPTFVLRPERVWVLNQTAEQTVMGVHFPVAVPVPSLQEHLTVEAQDGTVLPAEVTQGTDETTYAITLRGDPAWPLDFVFGAGITTADGTIHSPEQVTLTYPYEKALYVTTIAWERVMPDVQRIRIDLSSAVEPEALASHLQIENADTHQAIPFNVVTGGRSTQHSVALELPTPEQIAINVTVTKFLEGTDKSVLQAPFTQKLIRQPDYLRLTDTYWSNQGKDGLALYLGFTKPVDSQTLKEHLTVDPPIANLRVEPAYGSTYAVYGDWRSKQRYTVQISSGFKDKEGIALPDPLEREVTSEQVEAYLEFGFEGQYYVPRRPGLALPLDARNLTEAQLTVSRVFPSNLVVALENIRNGAGDYRLANQWSEELQQTDVALQSTPDVLTPTPVPLDTLLPESKRGLFVIGATAKHLRTYKVVLATDIGVLAHWQKSELLLFAHNLYSLAPLPGAKVSIYSRKNQLLGVANTDEQGIIHFKHFDPALGEPKLALVERGEDYTFLDLEPRQEGLGVLGNGMPPYDRKGYDAFFYGDRNLYRPGETVHLRWLVRTGYGKALGEVPLLLKVRKPNGQELLSQPVTLSALGTGNLDLTTQKAYPTGSYYVSLAVPGDTSVLGSYRFSLEDFVPNRIETAVKVDQTDWIAGKPYSFAVSAKHLFGAPAQDRKCEAVIVPTRGEFKSDRWKEFRFGNDSKYAPEPITVGEEQTNENGTADFDFTYTAPKEVTFPMPATVIGRVYELGGRAVANKADVTLFPSDIALGVALETLPGGGIRAHVCAIQPDETPAQLASVKVTLEKRVWNYYVRRYYDRNEPNWAESFDTLETKDVTLTKGRGAVDFANLEGGNYQIRVHSDQTPQYSTRSFYAYGSWFQPVTGPEPSLISLTLDKDTYTIGDSVKVRIESPFDGQGILVMQGEHLQQMVPISIQDGVGTYEFIATADQVPNVWVEATVIHAIELNKKTMYPFSSFAMANVPVHDPARKLSVAFPGIPASIRPGTTIDIPVQVTTAEGTPATAEVTVAAVDEGIHALTDYATPDPYQWLMRSRRADVRRAHYYDKVAYDFEGKAIGGGMAKRVGKVSAPVGENWIKPVALWSGTLMTDTNGQATAHFDVPEFNGRLRVVAVAASTEALGAQEAPLIVTRPYILRTSLPRFLLPQDRAVCRATLFNTTDAPCKATVTWTASGTLESHQESQHIEVAPKSEATLLAPIAATDAIGQGNLKWEVAVTNAQGASLDTFEESDPLPVRPPASYQSRVTTTVLHPGEEQTFQNTAFVETPQMEMGLTVGASPVLRLQGALDYLVGYPYGCIEQTLSRLMPMYALRQNTALIKSALGNTQRLDGYLAAGVERLYSMQTANGGLAMWPGGGQPYPYGSVYGLHFLTLMKRDRIYDVQRVGFDHLTEYVWTIANNWTDPSPSALYLRAYALYVLALNGDTKAIEQIGRFDDIAVPTAARYLLAAALAINTQDTDRVKMYLQSKPVEKYLKTELDGTLNSPVRTTAVELLALVQMNGDTKAMSERADILARYLAEQAGGNTQETAFAATALGMYLNKLGEDIEGAAATITGTGGPANITGNAVFENRGEGPGIQYTVKNTGTTDMFVNLSVNGIPKDAPTQATSQGIKILRQYFTPQATSVDGDSFTQGDAYVVRLVINCERDVQNAIVSDALPAGLEVENPRLDPDTVPQPQFQDGTVPTYLDLRDDRLVLAFDTLHKGVYHYYYAVRAVTPGTFERPQAVAECMYDAGIRGTTDARTIEVGQ